ncbi:MAG: ATP-binding protein, partial [Alphaproteobacteria bacterium]|nr:ATP-binding protein [Alphaproteobacteria bacterium]
METKQFISISKEGENSRIEYKTCYDQISYSLYESVCSFLNHNGGYILIGVNDKGKIIGLNPDKIQDLRNNIITTVKNKDLFMPTIYLTPEIVYVEDKVVMALHVPCGQYVYRYNG